MPIILIQSLCNEEKGELKSEKLVDPELSKK